MRRINLVTWSLAVTATGAIADAIVRFNPLGILRPCFLRMATGIPCPSCGTTRALRDLFGGRVGAALASNPLAVGIALAAASSAIAAVAVLPWADRIRTPRAPGRRAILWIAIILIVANWIYLIGTATR